MIYDSNGNPIEYPECYYTETKEVIKLLQNRQKANLPKWKHSVSFNEFKRGLSNWKEATSTSPSGRHLGMYKAILAAAENRNEEFDTKYKGKTIQELADEILTLMYQLAVQAMDSKPTTGSLLQVQGPKSRLSTM